MKLSTCIRELQKLVEAEGDIAVSCEGFFGEIMPAKLHLRNRSTKRNAYHSPTIDGDGKGERLLEISHS